MNTAVESTAIKCIVAVTADPASNRPGVAVTKIAIAIIFPWVCAPKFSSDEADSRNQTISRIACRWCETRRRS